LGYKKLGKAFDKYENPVDMDVSKRMFNVPTSIGDLPASGVDFSVGGTVPTGAIRKKNGRSGFKSGKKEGMRLTKNSRRSALRKLRV